MINSYWISPDGIHHPVTTSQIEFISNNLNLLGLTSTKLKEEALILELYNKGWIFCKYNSKRNCWIIHFSGKFKSIKLKVYDWIMQNNILSCKPHFLFSSSLGYNSNMNYKEIERFLTEKGFAPSQRCLSCRYSVWAVGVGQGFFCVNQDRINDGGDRVIGADFKRFLIPYRNYVCDNFEDARNKTII